MSIDYTVYVGPWFECRCLRVAQENDPGKTCRNSACVARGQRAMPQALSCSLCGWTLGGGATRREVDAVNPQQVPGVPEDELIVVTRDGNPAAHAIPEGVHVWLPNLTALPTGRCLSADVRREGIFQDLREAQVGEVQWLLGEYRDEFRALQSAYGAGRVEVCWGVLVYTS